jgi:hypothetical protein
VGKVAGFAYIDYNNAAGRAIGGKTQVNCNVVE